MQIQRISKGFQSQQQFYRLTLTRYCNTGNAKLQKARNSHKTRQIERRIINTRMFSFVCYLITWHWRQQRQVMKQFMASIDFKKLWQIQFNYLYFMNLNNFCSCEAVRKFHRNLRVYMAQNRLTLQRAVTGTARMLHALTHSSISRQVREQM